MPARDHRGRNRDSGGPCLIPAAVGLAVALVLLRNASAAARAGNLLHLEGTPLTASPGRGSRLLGAKPPAHRPLRRRRRSPPSHPSSRAISPSRTRPPMRPDMLGRLLSPLGAFGMGFTFVAAFLLRRLSVTSPPASPLLALPSFAPMSMAASTANRQLVALCPVADGTEDIEFTTATDVLVRAGIKVVTASVMPSKTVTLARGLTLTAQVGITDVSANQFDLVVCAGGMPGADHFRLSKPLNDIVVQMKRDGKLHAAICATPCVMFGNNPDIMKGLQRVTSYPAFHGKLRDLHPDLEVSTDPVVVDGQCVTSQGPGTSMAFALKVVELAVGRDTAAEVAKGMLYSL
eukprot:TRINITY_DN2456_c0_g1_i1.p1 TRINITY_DN2456_c0_g1~~TRINITY_DN2456_c0_g1_i1.p1  ORF type:complete len:360 (+),score=62.13 TRINITY_DN2456_c0_g1_i1:41-1081(+)